MTFTNIRRFVLILSAMSLTLCAIAFGAQSVQGAGETNAISQTQFQGPGQVRIGRTDYPVVSTATILSLGPGAGHTLAGTSTHTIDFGGGNTLVTMDEAVLVPMNAPGVYEMHIRCDVQSGTGALAGSTGQLMFNGRINLAIGHADWQLTGQIR